MLSDEKGLVRERKRDWNGVEFCGVEEACFPDIA
jgi:hypothetical protein